MPEIEVGRTLHSVSSGERNGSNDVPLDKGTRLCSSIYREANEKLSAVVRATSESNSAQTLMKKLLHHWPTWTTILVAVRVERICESDFSKFPRSFFIRIVSIGRPDAASHHSCYFILTRIDIEKPHMAKASEGGWRA